MKDMTAGWRRNQEDETAGLVAQKWINFSNNIDLRMPSCSGLTTCEMGQHII